MAHLNVRDRRMETKIAYVGAKLAGKATNLRHLKSDEIHGRSSDLLVEADALSLEWRPLRREPFDDCDVAVNVIAAKGEASPMQLDQILASADGVVVVVDSARSAQEETARVLALVRNAIAAKNARPIPVVVQANKVDLDDAASVQDIAASVDWPVIPASAARGEGVIETIETALAKVLAAMKDRPTVAASTESETSAKADPHPLLSALRAVLRETAAEHMAELERQAAERIASSVSEALDRSERLLSELRTMMLMNAKETARALASQEAALGNLAGEVRQLSAAESGVTTRLDHLTANQQKLQDDLAARSRTDREHVTALTSAIKRNIQALEVDMRRLDAREHYAHVAAELAKLDSKVETLATSVIPGVASMAGVPARLGALESSLQRELRDRVLAQLTRLEDSVQVLHVDTGESLQRADARAGEIQGGLNELLDELKKRKKGWFS